MENESALTENGEAPEVQTDKDQNELFVQPAPWTQPNKKVGNTGINGQTQYNGEDNRRRSRYSFLGKNLDRRSSGGDRSKRNITYLDDAQMNKLEDVMNRKIPISSKDGEQVLYVSPKELMNELRNQCYYLKGRSGPILKKNCTRLVGSGAAYVLSDRSDFNDLDFTFYIDTPIFSQILFLEEQVVYRLLEIQEQQNSTSHQDGNSNPSPTNHGTTWLSFPSNTALRAIYDKFFLDSIKIDSADNQWSLITLGKKGTLTMDIKFVYRAKRSYVFSSDSFEIILDPLFERSRGKKKIQVESLYGDIAEALEHLRTNTLVTRNPSEIRLGLLRYCYERIKGRKVDNLQLETNFVKAFLAEMDQTGSPTAFEDAINKFLQKHIQTPQVTEYLQELLKLIQDYSNSNSTSDSVQQYLCILQDLLAKYSPTQ